MPLMKQPARQLPEVLQTRPAPQLVPAARFGPPQAPAVQVSGDVQALPSLHAVPLDTFVNALVDVPGWHVWHWLPGFAAPEA